jgi:hypothetical protein
MVSTSDDYGFAEITIPRQDAAPATPLAVTTTSPLPSGAVGTPYSTTLAAEGGVPGYTWSLVDGVLPAGLVLNASGTITGTPTAGAVAAITVRVTDSVLSYDEQALSLTTTAPSGTVTVTAQRSGTGAIVTLRGALSYQTSCTVTAGSASATSTSGTAVRRVALSGLDPAEAYTVLADCGAAGSGSVSAAATPVVTGTGSVVVQAAGSFTVEYGVAWGSSVASTGGSATVTALPMGEVFTYRICRTTSGGAQYAFPR